MAEKTTIARPYATAVFELARESGKSGEWSGMLERLSLVVADPRMQTVLDNPVFAAGARADFIIDVCNGHLDEQGQNLVRVLSAAGRLALAPQIYRLYEQKRLVAEDIIEVDVLSAYPLEQAEQDRIAAAMAGRFGKQVAISIGIDESLIGGVVVRTGDAVIDASIKGRLKQLGRELTE